VIGVAASAADLDVAAEFFELFKTPWEPLVEGRRYRVAVSTDDRFDDIDADVVLSYGSIENGVDRWCRVGVFETQAGMATWNDQRLPFYGGLATFGANGRAALHSAGRAVDYAATVRGRRVRRIGYDLFGEVRHLLTEGQPATHALTPTLDVHIELLRQILIESGVSFVEIPPRPEKADFICCLTHDIDFFGIRRHGLDRTMAGFLIRGSIGSLLDVIGGRRTLAEAVDNWLAVCTLPLVFLGLRQDPWNPFEDYARIEATNRSTFFLLPFKGRPGVAPDGTINAARAVRYQASDVGPAAMRMAAGGSELAVHGIDAWRDRDAGRLELSQLTALTGGRTAGTRMHWLYFDRSSPRELEAAGFDYDSTCGYNDAVGYRAGTSQVFRWPGTQHLMELPLSIMDSALFYSDRMGLTREEAARQCHAIIVNARRYGGTVTINWHDRSLAPERQWGRSYRQLLDEISQERVWYATAGQAVEWFRWRRSIRFSVDAADACVTIQAPAMPLGTDGPGAIVRVQRPGDGIDDRVTETRFDGHQAVRLDVGQGVSSGETSR